MGAPCDKGQAFRPAERRRVDEASGASAEHGEKGCGHNADELLFSHMMCCPASLPGLLYTRHLRRHRAGKRVLVVVIWE